MTLRLLLAASLSILALAGCESLDPHGPGHAAVNAAIRAEQPGNYFIGRRMFKYDYKFWGWVREPGKPWKTARLVMLNEQRTLAPDRQINNIGSDNNHEYKLSGYFSGESVYEPASNRIYPEFVLTGYEVKSTAPPNIYKSRRQTNPRIRSIQPPI
ncbi:MAG: hypothetical protein ACK5L6_05120 [Anaerorhabdus sp.]|uniref:hypothetical protein n=1 Tax=Anaerorhabdus sp. TaxID=1872524 RepID=UPI003A89F40D